MQVEKKVLYDILLKLRPGLAKKEIIEQATHFIFTGDDIAVYNDRICITFPFKSDFKCSVKGEEFYHIISGAPQEFIDIKLDKEQLKIGSKKIKAGLSTLVDEASKVEDYIEKIKKDRDTVKWLPLPSDFIQGAFFCMFSASKDMVKGPYTCIFVQDKNIYSTDTLRASHYIMKDKVEKTFLIRAKDVAELVKFAVIEYGMSDNWAHYATEDGLEFSCRHIKEEYPYPEKVKTLFNLKSGTTLEFPKELKSTVDTVSVLAQGDVDINKLILVEIKKNEIHCSAQRERGWVEKSVDIKYDGPTVSFYINPIFFSQVLDKIKTATVSQDEHKAVFKSENFSHIIALPMEDE